MLSRGRRLVISSIASPTSTPAWSRSIDKAVLLPAATDWSWRRSAERLIPAVAWWIIPAGDLDGISRPLQRRQARFHPRQALPPAPGRAALPGLNRATPPAPPRPLA